MRNGSITYILLFLLITVHSVNVFAQQHSEDTTINLSLEKKVKPDYFLPAVEAIGLNILIWSYDCYIYQADWAVISLNSMKNNLKTGFVWDDNEFATNELSHPYHGSLYFNAARSSGINFWESIPYPIMGSLLWELFMESESPSTNDLIATPIGGIVLGEAMFRLSNLILYGGKDSFLRNLTAFFVSPMNVFNKLITGKKAHQSRIKMKHPHYSSKFSTGFNTLNYKRSKNSFFFNLYFNYNIHYGEYAKASKSFKPYDYFETELWASLSPNNNTLSINTWGVLLAKKMSPTFFNKGIFGLFQSFSYIQNNLYKLSETSIGTGILTKKNFDNNTTWNNTIFVSAIIHGTINSLYTNIGDRDYNFSSGISFQYDSNLFLSDHFSFFLKYNYYWFHTLSGTIGNDFLDILRLGLSYRIVNQNSISVEFVNYDRLSYYTLFPKQIDSSASLRIYYSFHFNQ